MFQARSPLMYRRKLLPDSPSINDVRSVVPDYAAMLVSVMTAIADRYDRRANYPYIDTKINLITGEDFTDSDPLRGHDTIYAWIQGRGLEALVDHCRWLRSHPEIKEGQSLIPRLERILREVSVNLWSVRKRNHGHVFFFMTQEGTPFVLKDSQAREEITSWAASFYSFSDTFVAKGLYAAAMYLNDKEVAADALDYCYRVDDAIWAGRFVSDERAIDPKKGPVPGMSTREQGPYMIQLGTAAVLADWGQDPGAIEMGLRLLRHNFRHFANVENQWPEFRHGDVWESTEEDGRPGRRAGGVPSNPGHAIELVGLGLKFTTAAKRHPLCSPEQRNEIARVEALMPSILDRNFTNGFLKDVGGICLRVDLATGARMSDIMPWWSLPEAIRAAAESWNVAASPEKGQRCLKILSESHNAFTRYYVRPELYLMAYQTRSTAGLSVPVIPATADADPGYHTGISIIDFLNVLDSSTEITHRPELTQ